MNFEPGLYETNTPTWWVNQEGGDILVQLVKAGAVKLERMTLWDRSDRTWLILRVLRELDADEAAQMLVLGDPAAGANADWKSIPEVITLEQSRHAEELAKANEPTVLEVAEQWITEATSTGKTLGALAAFGAGIALVAIFFRRR